MTTLQCNRVKKLNTIGVDIGGSKTAALFVGAGGEILTESSFPTNSDVGYDGFPGRLTAFIVEGISGGPEPVGIGIAAAATGCPVSAEILPGAAKAPGAARLAALNQPA